MSKSGPLLLDDPAHLRKRAQEARILADDMNDLRAKGTMLKIAEHYDELAERAKEHQQNSN